MRILVITDTFPRLSETFIINHIVALIESGHEVRIVARNESIEPKMHPMVEKYELLEKTLYFELPKSYLKRFLNVPKAIIRIPDVKTTFRCLNPLRYGPGVFTLQALYRCKVLPEQHFDLIHCHYGTIASSCLYLKDRYNAPLITSFHSCALEGKWQRFLFQHLFRHGDVFIANSIYTQKCLEYIGCPHENIQVIPTIAFTTNSKKSNRILFSSNIVTIMTVARLVEAKGIQYCLKAIKKLSMQGYKIRYIIVGDGPYGDYLKRLMPELDLDSIVHFTGWLNRNEVVRHYEDADILVVPSVKGNAGRMEAQGLVIQEAQQYGLVTVGSNIGGIPQSLNWGKAGVLFESENVEDLAEKLKNLLDNPEYARRIGQSGNAYFLENYSNEVLMDRLNSLYMKVLKIKR